MTEPTASRKASAQFAQVFGTHRKTRGEATRSPAVSLARVEKAGIPPVMVMGVLEVELVLVCGVGGQVAERVVDAPDVWVVIGGVREQAVE